MTDPRAKHRLSPDEVYRRLEAYAAKIPEASSIALTFGQQLLEEVMNRSGQIDSKGISVLGWSGAVLAFLLVHAPAMYRGGSLVVELLGTIATVLAFVAAFSGMWSSRTRRWRGTSDETWFPDPGRIKDAEHLRLHYLAELHESRATGDEICQRKADWLRIGQFCLAFAAYLIVLMLLYELMITLAGFGPALTPASDGF